MFLISAHFIFGGHLSYFYYLSLVKLEQTKTNNLCQIQAKEKKHESFQAGSIIKDSISWILSLIDNFKCNLPTLYRRVHQFVAKINQICV